MKVSKKYSIEINGKECKLLDYWVTSCMEHNRDHCAECLWKIECQDAIDLLELKP